MINALKKGNTLLALWLLLCFFVICQQPLQARKVCEEHSPDGDSCTSASTQSHRRVSDATDFVLNNNPYTISCSAGTISGTTTICAGATIQLNSNGDAGGTWSSSNTAAATVNSSGLVNGVAGGTSVISYTVTDGGCTNTATILITVNPLPTATITGGGNFCGGSSIDLTASGGVSYSWARRYTNNADIGPAITLGTSATQTVTQSGVYFVTVTNSAGCNAVTSKIVNIADYVFSGSINGTEPTQLGRMLRDANVSTCSNVNTCTLAGNTGDRAFDQYSITNPTSSPVCVTVGKNANGCGNSSYIITYLNSFNPGNICTNYLGREGASEDIMYHEVIVPANQTLVVVVHAVEPGQTCGSYNLYIDMPASFPGLTVTGPNTACQGTSINLSATAFSNATYSWAGSGVTASTTNATTATPTASGSQIYTVTVSTVSGCKPTTASKVVSVNALPNCPSGFGPPVNGQTGVTFLDSLRWTSVPNITGYLVYFGNNAPNYDNILNGVNNGTGNRRGMSLSLTPNTTYGYRIVPVNDCGEAVGCPTITFSTCVPSFTCPANRNVNLNGNCAMVIPDLVTGLAANPGCGSLTFTQSPTAGTTVGSSHNGTVSVVITPSNPNVAPCTVILTGKDVTPPSLTCPANTTINVNASCQATLPLYVPNGADNCSSAGFYFQTPSQGTVISGHNTVQLIILTVNDGNGNTSTCTLNVTLKDVTPPTIICPTNPTIAANASCQGTLGSIAATTLSDNCNPSPAVTQSPASSTILTGHNATQTVTLTANDGNGNTATCSTTVTLKDITPPTITCPPNATVAANASCQGTLSAYSAVSVADNCNPSPTVVQSPASSTVLTGHNTAQTVTLTANDGNGNTSTCTLTVTLKDITPPTITCPPNATVAANASCQGTLSAYSAVSVADNCNPSPTVVQSPASSTVLTGHNTAQTVTLTANDGNGNTATCTLTVTLKDITPPTITCPPNATVAANASCQGTLSAYSAVSVADNCNPSPTVVQSPANSTVLTGHNTAQTVTLTANDGNGNTATCTLTVTLKDITPPTITCPQNRSVNADAGQCSSVQTYTVTASDNCAYTLTRTNGFASGSAFPLGFNVVNWQVTDAGGSSTICSFSITVVDNQTPSITCPSSSTVAATTGLCAAVVNYSVNGSDNCSGWSLLRTSGLQSGALFPVGTTTVTWRNTDTGGNSTTCSFSVTVTDGQLPGITCPANITANAATGGCTATVNYATPTVSDNCSGASAMHVSGGVSGSSFNKGVNTVQWKATDGANNTRTCSFTITVNDTQAPTITCPVNITANTGANTCAANVNFNNATATDNCTPPPTVAQTGGQASGSSFPKGMHTLTFLATDGVGLTKACTFRITVVDNVLPTITCPSNIVKNTDNNLCSAVTNYTVTGTDNCTSVSVSRVSGLASGAAFPRGSSTVIWRATDLAGNSTLCSFTVTVNDAQLPNISCPASISTNTTTGQCSRVVNYTTPTYSDNCASGSISLLSGLASGSVFPTGVSTVIWRAFDNSANSADCAFTITVTDNQQPEVTCPPSATVSGSGSPCGYPASQLNTATATDNCAVTSLASDAPASLPAGANTIIWTAGDAAGNQKTCAYTVTVNCGASAGAKDEVVSMKDEERYEVGGMKDEARTSLHSLIPHHSSLITHHLSLSPNPASDIVVVTLSNQQDLSRRGINNKSNQQSSGSNQHHAGPQQQLNIYDALGRLVWSRKVTEGVEQVLIDLEEAKFTDGVYYISLYSTNGAVMKSLVVSKR